MEQEQNPYLVEVLRGARSIGYYAVFCLLALGPLIAESIVYRCKPDAEIQVILMLLISVFLCLSTEIPGKGITRARWRRFPRKRTMFPDFYRTSQS